MKHVIGFFGGDSQVGTTMIAQSLAEFLADQGCKVLLILGSGNYGDAYLRNNPGHSIDDLKAGIRSGKVDTEELMQSLQQKKNLWVLPGVRNPLTAKYFPENTYDVLLKNGKSCFDYAIIDGGCDYQLGITISALNYCDSRYFVITQQAKSLARYGLYQRQIFQPLGIEGKMIINKYVRDPALFLKADVLKFCAKDDALQIPYTEYGWQAEMEGTTLLQYHNFYKAIERLAGDIAPEFTKERKWKLNFV